SPPDVLLEATQTSTAAGVSTLVSSVLLAAAAVAIVWSWDRTESALWVGAVAVIVYAVTSFTVTAGMLIGGGAPGDDGGFYAGHMA
ncbi:DUF2339 domain-containing protein, partial [Mycobacterium sp. ITM-2017-0098]